VQHELSISVQGTQYTTMFGVSGAENALCGLPKCERSVTYAREGYKPSTDVSRHGTGSIHDPTGIQGLVEALKVPDGSLHTLDLRGNPIATPFTVERDRVIGTDFNLGAKLIVDGREVTIIGVTIFDAGFTEVMVQAFSGIYAIAESLKEPGSLGTLNLSGEP